MNTLIKYLSLEAIENTVTCLNYQIDKVIFFGRLQAINEEHKNITNFLKKYCEVKEVIYHYIDNKDYETIKEALETLINNENNCFFDFTGDEGIFEAVAFKVANLLDVPVHTYDVWHKKAIVIKNNIDGIDINRIKREMNIKVTINSYIEMIGGKIKEYHKSDNKKYINENLLELRKSKKRQWHGLCQLFGNNRIKDTNTFCCANINTELKKNHYGLDKDELLNTIKEFKKIGIIKEVLVGANSFRFDCLNSSYAYLISEVGAVLEQIVYSKEQMKNEECAIGVAFYWNGMRLTDAGVNNEIDVLCLNNYNLTFISCKDSNELKNDYLYELQAVARGFAGNYVNMKLVTTARKNKLIEERAKELGIIVEYQHF